MVDVLKRLIPGPPRRLIGRVLVRLGIMKRDPSSPQLQAAIISAVALSVKGEPGAGEALVQRILGGDLTTHPGLPPEYIAEFVRAIEQRRSLVIRNDATDALLQRTTDLDASCLPSSRWLLLHAACIRNGLFKAAGPVRDKGIQAAYREASAPRAGLDCLVQAFKVAVDQSEFDRAQAVLERVHSLECDNRLRDDLQLYYYLNMGDTPRLRTLSRERLGKQDPAFAEYIHDRSIAIIGPAPSGDDAGADIDSSDILIRFNYRGRQFLGPANEFGCRTDVSYYNLDAARRISNMESLTFFDELRFSIFKRMDYDFQERLLRSQRGRVFRWNRFHFAGTAMALQNALYDLFHFQPRRVSIMHVNFFLAHNQYHAGYAMDSTCEDTPQDKVRKMFMQWHSFAHHGLLNQVNFIRNLWKAGLVLPQGSCEAVLRLTPSQYLSQMEEVWVINRMSEYARHLSDDSG